MQITTIVTIWSGIPTVPLIGVAPYYIIGTLQGGRHFQVAILFEFYYSVFWLKNLIEKMSSRRSIQHPELDLVRLRPMKDEQDLPTVQEHMLPANFGKSNVWLNGR